MNLTTSSSQTNAYSRTFNRTKTGSVRVAFAGRSRESRDTDPRETFVADLTRGKREARREELEGDIYRSRQQTLRGVWIAADAKSRLSFGAIATIQPRCLHPKTSSEICQPYQASCENAVVVFLLRQRRNKKAWKYLITSVAFNLVSVRRETHDTAE